MYKGRTYLGVVPARGGSKRLPRKNILDLNGKPLIAYSIESGLNTMYIDTVVVTSDDDDILNIAKKYETKYIVRPDYLSSDTATTYSVIKHAIKKIKMHDYIVLLQPTSPLRTHKHISEAIELLESKNADAIISVCEMDHSPLWANTLKENASMSGFLKNEILSKRSQELEKYYRVNGAIYICRTDKLLKEGTFYLKDNIFAYIMERDDSIDIDDKIDFKIASVLQEKN